MWKIQIYVNAYIFLKHNYSTAKFYHNPQIMSNYYGFFYNLILANKDLRTYITPNKKSGAGAPPNKEKSST